MLGTLITTGCRIGALCRLRVGDLRTSRGRPGLSVPREKRQTERAIPVRDDLDRVAPGVHRKRPGSPKTRPSAPLWRAALRGGSLARRRRRPSHAVRAMLKRRLAAAGLPAHLTPHSFRVMVVTALLNQNVPVEEVQHLVGHSHPSTTQLYDRRQAAHQPQHRRAHPLLVGRILARSQSRAMDSLPAFRFPGPCRLGGAVRYCQIMDVLRRIVV